MKKIAILVIIILCSGLALFGGNDESDSQALIDDALKKNPKVPLVAVQSGIILDSIGSPVLQVMFYNRSEKDIDAFEFDCLLQDAFGRTVLFREGRFKGLAQHIVIGPQQTGSLEWNLFIERNAVKAK
jgi:hypothetical protein